MKDAFLLFGFAALTFGLTSVLFGNWRKLNEIISEGKLDFYLSLPKNELLHILISKTFFHSWGDVLFGSALILLSIDYSFTSILTAITGIITGSILTIAFAIIINSLAFFFGSTKSSSDLGFQVLLAFSSYPLNVFDGFMRFLLFFVIPLGFITNVPVELLKEFNPKLYLALLLVTIIVSLIAYGLFKLGLKRYESGNTINVQI
ncbi:ABC-2 family transporter protein [Candidatus Woesearchaeota archaeon]|nr:ABC-2 family transporter protein [Candidatus Woesearchaeota archaeon]